MLLHALRALQTGNKVCIIGKAAQGIEAGGRVFALFCYKCGADPPQACGMLAAQGHINSVSLKGGCSWRAGPFLLLHHRHHSVWWFSTMSHTGRGRPAVLQKAQPARQCRALAMLKNEVAGVAFKRYGADVVQHAGHEHVLACCTRKAQAFGKSPDSEERLAGDALQELVKPYQERGKTPSENQIDGWNACKSVSPNCADNQK